MPTLYRIFGLLRFIINCLCIYTKNVRLVSFNLEFRGNLDYLL